MENRLGSPVSRRRFVAATATLAAAPLAAVACGQTAGPAKQTSGPANLYFATLYKEDPSWLLSKQQLDEFSAQFPNIKVQPDWITGATTDYLKKVQTYLAGGTQPDVLYIHYLQTSIFGAQGVLMDHNKYAQQDKSFNAADLVPGVYDHFRYQDKPLGVPWYSGPHTLLFNKTLFQKLGIKTPDQYEKEGKWTWEAMREVAIQLTKGTPGSPDRTLGLVLDSSARLGRWERWAWQNGGELFNKEHTKSQFNNPAVLAAMDFVTGLYTKDKVVVTSEESSQLGGSTPFTSGRVGMQHGIARDAMTVPVDAAKSGGWELGLVPLPKGKAGRQNIDGPQAYGIGAATKFPDAAWQLVRWWADEQRQAKRLELGASVPVRKSMQKSKSFLDALRPFESATTIEEAANNVRAPFSPPNLTDIEKITGDAWNAMIASKQSVKDAMDQVTAQVDPLLKA